MSGSQFLNNKVLENKDSGGLPWIYAVVVLIYAMTQL